MKLIPYFKEHEYELVKNMKIKRIDSQYYLKDIRIISIEQVKNFLIICKYIIANLNASEMQRIKDKLKLMAKQNPAHQQ